MKKFLTLTLSLLFCISLMLPVSAAMNLGTDLTKQAASKAGYDPGTTNTTFAATLGTVVKAVLSFVGILFLGLMIYAGFLWMNARGDEGEVDKAKEIIKAAVIGMIITVGAYSITNFVVPIVLQRTAGAGQ